MKMEIATAGFEEIGYNLGYNPMVGWIGYNTMAEWNPPNLRLKNFAKPLSEPQKEETAKRPPIETDSDFAFGLTKLQIGACSPRSKPTTPISSDSANTNGNNSVRNTNSAAQQGVEIVCCICFDCSNSLESSWFSCSACSSRVCTTCLTSFLEIETGGSQPLQCVDPMCTNEIPQDVAVELLGPERVAKHEKHLKMKEDADLRECPHCGDLQKGNAAQPNMVCTKCRGQFCFFHDLQHAGKKCSGKRRTGVFSTLYLNMKTTKCPTCKARVQRTSGCPHMVCSLCKTNFCYYCGKGIDHHMYFHQKLWGFRCNSSRSWAKRIGAPIAGAIAVAVSPIVAPIYFHQDKFKRAAWRRKVRFW
mmetsp:Transcript_62651/g.130226  ORF Transcript_62651/g.130226 Transcript_62651/m.130226 type:complete len:360 (-) Transcript_62651:47-1126(-)